MMDRSGSRARRGLRPHAQTADAPRIDVEHLELGARRMADDLAALGDSPKQGEDQATHRVDLASLVLGEDIADLLLEELDGCAAIDVDRAVDPARDGRR